MTLHPLIARLLDGEIQMADLPPELRAEGERPSACWVSLRATR